MEENRNALDEYNNSCKEKKIQTQEIPLLLQANRKR